MINLLIQMKCLIYSFFYSFVMCGIYQLLNRFLKPIPLVLRYMVQVVLGMFFGFLYYRGLVYLNEGILRIYFFIMLFMGYLFYCHYYAVYVMVLIEKMYRRIVRLLSPFIFFFHLINGIMRKRLRGVKKKWLRKKKQDIKNA